MYTQCDMPPTPPKLQLRKIARSEELELKRLEWAHATSSAVCKWFGTMSSAVLKVNFCWNVGFCAKLINYIWKHDANH